MSQWYGTSGSPTASAPSRSTSLAIVTRELGEVRGVTARGRLRRALVEPRAAMVAQRLEHPEAPRRAALGLDHRVLRQRDEQVEHGVAVEPVAAADVLGVLEPERPGEHRQPPEQLLLVGGQQRVAGLDRRLERAAAAEHAEAVRRAALGDRGGRQRAHARGGELDRQRQAVDPAADPGDRVALGGVGDPVGPRRGGALPGTAPRRLSAASGRTGTTASPAKPSGRRLVTSTLTPSPVAASVARDGAEVGDEVLGVVEDDEQPGAVEALAQDPERVAVAVLVAGADAAHAQRAATAGSTSPAERSGASSTSQAPSGMASSSARAASRGERRLADAGGADAA